MMSTLLAVSTIIIVGVSPLRPPAIKHPIDERMRMSRSVSVSDSSLSSAHVFWANDSSIVFGIPMHGATDDDHVLAVKSNWTAANELGTIVAHGR